MGIYCLYFNDVLLLIKSLLSKYFSTVREYSSLAICKQQLSSIHTENLMTELCLMPIVIVGKFRWE